MSRQSDFSGQYGGRHEKRHRKAAGILDILTEVMEIVVAVIILVGFCVSVIPLLMDMPGLLDNTNEYSFHVFLEHAFNLVIGIEFVRMLIRHTPGSALDVLLFAIARHMVLDVGNGAELLLCVASIAGIFAIRKFLFVKSFEPAEKTSEENVHDDRNIEEGSTEKDGAKGTEEQKDGAKRAAAETRYMEKGSREGTG